MKIWVHKYLLILLKSSFVLTSILVLNGGMAMTIVSGVVGSVDSVAKEIKINKLENKVNKMNREKNEED